MGSTKHTNFLVIYNKLLLKITIVFNSRIIRGFYKYIPLILYSSFRLNDSLWFDEAAVMQNVSQFTFLQAFDGLNWLQTIPPLYFLVLKFFILLNLPIEIIRLFSLLSIVIGLELVYFISGLSRQNKLTKALFLCFTVNPVILQYATLIKPYAIEFMIVPLGYLFLIKKQKKLFLTLIIFGLPLSTTSFVGLISLSLGFLIINKSRFYLISTLLIVSLTGLLTQFTPTQTRLQFREFWFGNYEYSLIIRFKQSLDNLLNFSASPFGFVPQNFPPNLVFIKSAISSLALIYILFYARKKFTDKNSLAFLLIISFVVLSILEAVLYYPAAGRLSLGIGAIFWCFIFQIKQHKKFVNTILIICLLFTISKDPHKSINGESRNGVKTALREISPVMSDNIYSDLDNLPGLQYYLKNDNIVSSSVLYVKSSRLLGMCEDIRIPRGSLLFLNNFNDGIEKNFQIMSRIIIGPQTTLYVYKTEEEIIVPATNELTQTYLCKFPEMNPRYDW
jgi:hypothetical protein